MDKPGNPAKFSPEMRERAVRMVFEHRHEYSGISRIASAFQSGHKLHSSRFARIHELTTLMTDKLSTDTSLLLGTTHLGNVLRVRPIRTRRELGNLLVVAPTRGGKGLLATAQLLTWGHSVIVNDIKGELFTQTAGYRSTLGPVYVIDPTGAGHRYDPLHNRHTEDELLSSATHLLYKPDEGDGAILSC
jgi:Type IV secretory system Conjugative DNA transfer